MLAEDSFFLTEQGRGRSHRQRDQALGAVLPQSSVQQLQRPGRAVWGEWLRLGSGSRSADSRYSRLA